MAKGLYHKICMFQKAINKTFPEERILVCQNQFYSEDKKRAVTMIVVKKVCVDSNGKKTTKELYSSVSQIRIVLFLKDYWFQLNGWELPTDNEEWEKAKEQYRKRRGVE